MSAHTTVIHRHIATHLAVGDTDDSHRIVVDILHRVAAQHLDAAVTRSAVADHAFTHPTRAVRDALARVLYDLHTDTDPTSLTAVGRRANDDLNARLIGGNR